MSNGVSNEQIVSITSQGQLTIPKAFRKRFGILKGAKAIIKQTGDEIIVKPKKSFLDFEGALKSKIKLTDAQLRKARKGFEKYWARPLPK